VTSEQNDGPEVVSLATLSIIKADTGGMVGHSSVHPYMIDCTGERGAIGDRLLRDGDAAACGDDLSLIMLHDHGEENEGIHRFAGDVFCAANTTAGAR
jgi:fructose 1,6-bisphosphate aldolase/phosphatase